MQNSTHLPLISPSDKNIDDFPSQINSEADFVLKIVDHAEKMRNINNDVYTYKLYKYLDLFLEFCDNNNNNSILPRAIQYIITSKTVGSCPNIMKNIINKFWKHLMMSNFENVYMSTTVEKWVLQHISNKIYNEENMNDFSDNIQIYVKKYANLAYYKT